MITLSEFDSIKGSVRTKAELNNKASGIWAKILTLLDAAAPLIFDHGKLRWYQVGRMYKLAKLLIDFIIELKETK